MKGIMLNERFGLETATLNGSKTRTSRDELSRKKKHTEEELEFIYLLNDEDYMKSSGTLSFDGINTFNLDDCCNHYDFKTKYKVGEIVAVKQRYKDIFSLGWNSDLTGDEAGWRNKMFVKNELMPHQTQITDIKLERLQDISNEDCMKEGILIGDFINTWNKYYYDIIGDCAAHKTFKTPQEAFASLIDKISGKGTWDRNEYNVVYYYKVVK